MRSISKLKSASLNSASQGAICSLIQIDAYLNYMASPVMKSTRSADQSPPRGVQIFLVCWLQIWLDWLRGEEYAADPTQIREPAILNRHDRRMVGRKIPPVRSHNILFHLFGKTMSRTQFLERLCMLSPLGRVRIYRFRYWGSVLQRQALLICYDHGWWRTPLSGMGRVNGGLWRVHLWPN